MKISNFKYIITNTGGGWVSLHELYGVTTEGDVYKTHKFSEKDINVDTNIECEYIGKLTDTDLGLKMDIHYAVMDASELTVYDVTSDFLVVHCAPNISENNPKLFEHIIQLEFNRLNSLGNHTSSEMSEDTEFKIGEVKTSDELRLVIQLLSQGGHKTLTTYHPSGGKEIIEKLKISNTFKKDGVDM